MEAKDTEMTDEEVKENLNKHAFLEVFYDLACIASRQMRLKIGARTNDMIDVPEAFEKAFSDIPEAFKRAFEEQ